MALIWNLKIKHSRRTNTSTTKCNLLGHVDTRPEHHTVQSRPTERCSDSPGWLSQVKPCGESHPHLSCSSKWLFTCSVATTWNLLNYFEIPIMTLPWIPHPRPRYRLLSMMQQENGSATGSNSPSNAAYAKLNICIRFLFRFYSSTWEFDVFVKLYPSSVKELQEVITAVDVWEHLSVTESQGQRKWVCFIRFRS